jgi:hypothetical protein
MGDPTMMKTTFFRSFLASASGLLLAQAVAFGQACEVGWTENLFPLAGVDGEVHATFTWDDGGGPAVYIGGAFTIAGSVNASNVASWDGQRWEALGSGTDGVVRSFGVFDDGSGEALYVGGDFMTAGGLDAAHIARWDGSAWSVLDDGVNGPVYAMTPDDGRLYVGGEFGTAGGTPARNLAWWDGDSWSGPPSGTSGAIRALLVHDDGGGERLFVGGAFVGVGGGVSARGIAAWDPGTQVWSAVGGGVNGDVNALIAIDGQLHVGGRFTTAGGRSAESVARWDGVEWTGLADGLDGNVVALAVVDEAGGTRLIAAGPFQRAGGEFFGNGIASWDGARWRAMGFGLQGIFDFYPRAIGVLDAGDGPRILAGGNLAGSNGIVEFNDGKWQDLLEAGRAAALVGSGPVAVLDFDGSKQMYFHGDFPIDGGGEARVGGWDGASLEVLFGGEPLPGYPGGLLVFDDGSGPAIYASGMSSPGGDAPVMRWDGAAWSTVGDPPLVGSLSAMCVFDDGTGPALYVGGHEMTVGAEEVGELVRWDGDSWTAVGGGLAAGSETGSVLALQVYDDGSGSALYAAGGIGLAGGTPVNQIARWDGAIWSDAGSGFGRSRVHDLAVFDEGAGARLFATGEIASASGVFTPGIARWDGDLWEPLEPGIRLNGPGNALSVFDDGSGEALYVGGRFSAIGGVTARRIVRWDGLVWTELDGGVDGSVNGLLVFDDGNGPALFASGGFERAGGAVSVGIARFGCNPADCRADLDGDGALTIFDFLAFQNLFDAGDLTADFDGDGALTLFDFLAFQNDFDIGC